MIAFLSNVNIEPMKAFYKSEEVYFTGYNQYAVELLDGGSALHSREIDTILLFIEGEEFLGESAYDLPGEGLFDEVRARLEDLLAVVEKYVAGRKGVVFVMSNMVLPPSRFTTFLDANTRLGFSSLENWMNERLKEFSGRFSNVLVFDWQAVVKAHGYDNLYDERFWYLGRVRLNNKAFSLMKEGLDGLVSAYRGGSKKVLVLDLDNTLWGGIIGEDGISGIALSEDGEGKAYRDFQRAVRSLKGLGVLLAVNSKNNEEDAREAFGRHPLMVLRYDDFVARKINWNDKVRNMNEISEELGIGVDSFVFIDDNSVERQVVRDLLPEVTVPDFPEDAAHLSRWFLKDVVRKYFPRVYLTREDLDKTIQYRANVERKALSASMGIEEFLRSLHIRLKVYVDPAEHRRRIAQLTQKTNQFNMTTRRYTESDVSGFMESPGSSVFCIVYEDRFGKEGIVAAAIVRARDGVATIDTFLMSCRTIGRNVEFAFLYEIMKALRKNGTVRVRAEFIPTARNRVAEGFFESAGFEKTAGGSGYESAPEDVMRKCEGLTLGLEVSVHG